MSRFAQRLRSRGCIERVSRAAIVLASLLALISPGSMLATSDGSLKSQGSGTTEQESTERSDAGSATEGAILRRDHRVPILHAMDTHPRRHAPTRGHLPTYSNPSGTGCQRAWLFHDLGAPLRI